MSDPVTVFINGVKGQLLSPADRLVYFFEWKAIFTIVAAVLTLLIQVFVFHQSAGSVSIWIVVAFWIVLLILESIKKYDALFHKENTILDGLVTEIIQYMVASGIPLPPDTGTQVRAYLSDQQAVWPKQAIPPKAPQPAAPTIRLDKKEDQ